MAFIEQIASYILKYAPQYNICVVSPIIAQAILESASGTSYKATFHNYFGLKYRDNRCPTSNGKFVDSSSEQNPDGSYKPIKDYWFSFPDMESGVIGYFDFTNISNYKNLKGVKSPLEYLENIKADNYASSKEYVTNNMNVIIRYNLTKYDLMLNASNKERVYKFNVHAGHNPDGKVACGAVGFIKESTEARIVKDLVIKGLIKKGYKAFDCTCEDGINQSDVLKKIVNKCNKNDVDLDISIHFNSGARDYIGNGISTGTEVLVYSETSKSNEAAKTICDWICKLGFKNRGVKIRNDLYFLKKTKAPACLIEVCFVDDKDDCFMYNANNVANQIVEAISKVYC